MVYYITEGMIDELKDKKTRKKFLKHINPVRVWSHIIKNRKNIYGNKSKYFLVTKAKPFMTRDKYLKKHSHPGFINAIKAITKLEDAENALKQLKGYRFDKIGDNLAYYEKTGIDRTHSNIKEEFVNKGITSEDCYAYHKWLHNVAIPLCEDKIKELKEDD